MNGPLKPIRQMRGMLDDATKQLAQLTGEQLELYARTFSSISGVTVNASEIERDIKQDLAAIGALPLDVQQLHCIRQMIVSAINRW